VIVSEGEVYLTMKKNNQWHTALAAPNKGGLVVAGTKRIRFFTFLPHPRQKKEKRSTGQ
jgi:hypothetical protein